MCAPYIAHPILLPRNMTQAGQEQAVLASQQADPLLSPACLAIYRRVVCASAYPSCSSTTIQARVDEVTTPVTVTVAYSALPCRSLCQEMLSVCPSILRAFFNCEATQDVKMCSGYTIASVEIYPHTASYYPAAPARAYGMNASCNTAAITPVTCSRLEPDSNINPLAESSTGATSPISSTTIGKCVPIPASSVCANVLSYATYADADTCFAMTEVLLDTRTWSALSTPCRNAFAQYQCTQTYTKCDVNTTNPNTVKPEKHVCEVPPARSET